MYFLVSIGVGLLFPEITLGAVVLVSLSNFVVLAGSVYLFGVRRQKMSWESIGLVPPQNLGKHFLIGAGLALERKGGGITFIIIHNSHRRNYAGG